MTGAPRTPPRRHDVHARLLGAEDLDGRHVARDRVALDRLASLCRASEANEAREPLERALVVGVAFELASWLNGHKWDDAGRGEEGVEPVEGGLQPSGLPGIDRRLECEGIQLANKLLLSGTGVSLENTREGSAERPGEPCSRERRSVLSRLDARPALPPWGKCKGVDHCLGG